jgi:hypothetical protein
VKTILQAMDDPNLFRPLFLKRASWEAWRAFLAALFALPMSPEQLAIYRACTGRTHPPANASSEAWLVCGRRAGKSFTLALIAVYLACFREYRQHLQPGERATVMIIALDRRQARVVIRFIQGMLQIAMLREAVEACIDHGLRERPPLPKIRYQAFVDPSGGSADSFTLAIAHREGDTAVLDAVRERRPKFSPSDVVEEFSELLKEYRVTRITGDRYAGEFPPGAVREARRSLRAERPTEVRDLRQLSAVNKQPARGAAGKRPPRRPARLPGKTHRARQGQHRSPRRRGTTILPMRSRARWSICARARHTPRH